MILQLCCYFSSFSSVQWLSHVRLFATPWTTAYQASLSITNSQSLPKPMFVGSVTPSNHFILCRPLLFLPSILPTIRVFSNKLALCIRWPKYWSFSFKISPSNEYPGLISFRMDWLDLLAVQGTLKSLLQHHSSKASILWRSLTWPKFMGILYSGGTLAFLHKVTFMLVTYPESNPLASYFWASELFSLSLVIPSCLESLSEAGTRWSY